MNENQLTQDDQSQIDLEKFQLMEDKMERIQNRLESTSLVVFEGLKSNREFPEQNTTAKGKEIDRECKKKSTEVVDQAKYNLDHSINTSVKNTGKKDDCKVVVEYSLKGKKEPEVVFKPGQENTALSLKADQVTISCKNELNVDKKCKFEYSIVAL